MITIILFFAFSLSASSQEVDEARQQEGRKLFKSLCASCHKLDKKLVGPALGGVKARREREWLIKWIRNNAELRASGDRDAIAIFEEYNGSAMSAFPQLTDQNIDDILYYTTVDIIDANEGAEINVKETLSQFDIKLKAQEGGKITAKIKATEKLICLFFI